MVKLLVKRTGGKQIMPEGVFNSKEFRELENLNKNLKDITKGLNTLNNTILKLNSRTNKNTLMSKIADGIESIGDSFKKVIKDK